MSSMHRSNSSETKVSTTIFVCAVSREPPHLDTDSYSTVLYYFTVFFFSSAGTITAATNFEK